MPKKLFLQAIVKVTFGILLIGLLIFLPAGTLSFSRGWLFMAVLFIPMLLAGIILMRKNPELLKRRLKAKETQKAQSAVIKMSGVMFVFGFIIAGLDFRFGWSEISDTVVVIATIVFLLSYLLYAEVIRENKYLSRTIEVSEDQTVVDTGLYGIVRHPMYMATLFLFLSMPLVLGSFWAFLVFLLYPALIVKRMKHEETFLAQNLDGYKEYQKKVKYRLIPFIW